MKLRTFFERIMAAACGPVRETDVIRAQMAAAQGRRERGQKGPRSAGRANPTGNARKKGKAHGCERRP